eukprot:SAG11_NODE_1240_length_5419_cov_20.037030_2_plen_786_part_00
MRTVKECSRLLGIAIDCAVRRGSTSRRHVEPLVRLDARLGYVALARGFQWRRRAWLFQHLINPKFVRQDTPGVYVFVHKHRLHFYIGRSIHCFTRYFQHLSSMWQISRQAHSRHPEDVFHRGLAAHGPGQFWLMFLVTYPPAPRGSLAAAILDQSLQHTERCFIYKLAARNEHTYNVVGTWRMRDHLLAERIGLVRAWHGNSAATPLHDRLPSPTWRSLSVHGAGARRIAPHRRALSRRRYSLQFDGRTCETHDLLCVLRALQTLGSPSDLPRLVQLTHSGHDLTRYRQIREHFGSSRMSIVYADGTVQHVVGKQCGELRYPHPRRPAAPPPAYVLLTSVQRPTTRAPTITAKQINAICWSRRARSEIFRTAYLLDFQRMYNACQRLFSNATARATRRARITRLCRQKFYGLHPGLAFVARIPSPAAPDATGATLTRAAVRRAIQGALRRHTNYDQPTTQAICDKLRVVFTAQPKVQDLFDNVRQHMREYQHGTVRACTCRAHAPWHFDGMYRDADGCACFTSAEYAGPMREILNQSCRTTLQPSTIDTWDDIAGAAHRIIDQLRRGRAHVTPTRAAIRRCLPAPQHGWANPAPPINARNAHALKALLCTDLVCARMDHGVGKLWFMCPARLDRLLPAALPIGDNTRFTVRRQMTEADALARMATFADEHAWLVPRARQRVAVPRPYPLLKDKAEDSPKFKLALRPVNPMRSAPFAAVSSVCGRATMYLIKLAAAAGCLPWVMISTNQLVPYLRQQMERVAQRFGAAQITRVRWHVAFTDITGFF